MVSIGRMIAGSWGMNVNRMMDALGLPDSVGDAIGAKIDEVRGDVDGWTRNVADLTSGLRTGDMDQLFGAGLPPSQYVPRPFDNYSHCVDAFGGGYGTPSIEEVDLGKGKIGKAIDALLLTNDEFRAGMNQMLGGMCIPDTQMDGKIKVLRYTPTFGGMDLTNHLMSANPMVSGVFRGLSLMEGNMQRTMSSMLNLGFNVRGAPMDMVLRDPETAQLAHGMGMQAPLSFEDILFLMMMKYGKKKEREILNKMDELSGKGGQKGSGVKKFLGTAAQVAGMAVGASAGGPLGLAIGNAVGSMVGQAISGEGGQGGIGGDQPKSDTIKQMEMQKLMEDLKKMYEMLSNTVKMMHDMQMTPVRNLR